MGSSILKKAIQSQEKLLHGKGRIFVRKSGTEPLIRIMVEGESAGLIEQIGETLAKVVRN